MSQDYPIFSGNQIILVMVIGLLPLLPAIRAAPSAGGESFVVVVLPWQDAAQLVHAAEGMVMEYGRVPFVVSAVSRDPAFGMRLKDASWALFLKADAADFLCVVKG